MNYEVYKSKFCGYCPLEAGHVISDGNANYIDGDINKAYRRAAQYTEIKKKSCICEAEVREVK